MYSNTPELLKREIITKSKQDTVPGVACVSPDLSFLPEELIQVLINNVRPYPNMSEVAENYYHVLSGLSTFDNYTEDIYWYINKLLLYLEYYQGIIDMRQYNLYGQMITLSKRRANEFIIRVPGLSEDRPSLRARDEIEIIQVDGENRSFGIIEFVGQDYVTVSLSYDFNKKFEPTQRYDIEFQYSTWLIDNLNFVLDTVFSQRLVPMLFPLQQSPYVRKPPSIEWINENIKHNPEQQQAVINIMNKTAQPAPYILFGPPGTGKTSTLVEAICQILKDNFSSRILICTPSNAAADEIAIRLFKSSIDESIMYRMYSASRNFDDVNDSIKAFSNFSDSESVFVSKDVFLRKRIVITTLSTCIRLYKYDLRENHFSYLFCDEAGQATEIETLIPLLLMSGADSRKVSKFCGQIVLAGDPKQLGPVILSRLAKPLLSISMLERLMEWGPYKKIEATNKYDPIYVTKLIQNYRCHPAILHLPNALFYDDELIAKAGDEAKRAENWFGLQKRNFPIIFRAVKGEEEREPHSPSVCNYSEVRVVVDYVKRLLNTNLGGKIVTPNEIGIITPYKLQKSKIQKALENENIRDVSVGTVEIFQGQERDIIIISSVRTKLYMNKGLIHIGFLSHPKRFNVAITRARALLIIVGDPQILEHDECWRALLQYCIENKACSGPKFTLSKHVKRATIRKLIAKKHVVDELNNSNLEEPVEEISDCESADTDDEDQNRRTRLPIGPLPEQFYGSTITSNGLEENSVCSDHELYDTTEEECYNDESDYEEDYSTESSISDHDESDDYFLASDILQSSSSSSSNKYLSLESIISENTDSFETELRDRMLMLTINEDS